MSLRRGSSSRGTNLIQDIYDIYNPVNVDRFEQHYEDLVDPATGEPAGTRVVIRIPKSYNTILHETDPLPDPRR
jgi:hypothetical protein